MPLKFQIKHHSQDLQAWGDIDKSAQWQTLKAGLDEGAEGIADAIREMYAVVKADVTTELTQANVWGPHHVIRQDGTLVMNRAGVIAAAAALAGARAEPDLTTSQVRHAAQHLLRHYRQEGMNLQPPENLLALAGAREMVQLEGVLVGEMEKRVGDIPLSGKISPLALKSGDTDPMEVVVLIPQGMSTRGWNYRISALKQIAAKVMEQGLPGFLGHQKDENIPYEFPTPVTHWVGALYAGEGKAYFRGVIDKAATDLKRWIRGGAIRQVSIFGYAETEQVNGETHVVGFDALSIDWVPLGRAGMATHIVAVGESANQKGGTEVAEKTSLTLAELTGELRKLGVKPGQIAGELGWKLSEVAGEIWGERWDQLLEKGEAVSEMKEVVGLSKESKMSDLVAAVKVAREAQVKALTADHDKLVDKVLGEMVQAEAARPLVKRMVKLDATADEATIKKIVGEMLEQEDVKKAFAGIFKDTQLTPKGDDRSKAGATTVTKRVTI